VSDLVLASFTTSGTDDRTNVVLLFLGCNMVVILLFTSSVFTSWISTHFSEASSTTFNPYLVSVRILSRAIRADDRP